MIVLKDKKRKYGLSKGKVIFICVMLAYPVLHFLINWLYINMQTILLSFQRYNIHAGEFQVPPDIFYNYKMWFNRFFTDKRYSSILLNSFLYFPVS